MRLKNFYKNKIEANFLFSLAGSKSILEVSESSINLLGFNESDFFTGNLKLKSLIHKDDKDIADLIFSNKTTPKFNPHSETATCTLNPVKAH